MAGDTQPTDEPACTDPEVQCFCPTSGVIDLLSRTHAMAVVCAVGALGPARYADIEDALGDVSSSTLSARLDELTDAGLLARAQYDEIPPRVEYELTDDGAELCERLKPVLEWVENRDTGA